MGDQPSKEDSPEDAEKQRSQAAQANNGPGAAKMHADFSKKNAADGNYVRAAFEEAVGNDKDAMEGIERIVRQLEGEETPEQKAERAEKESKSNAAQKAKAAEKEHQNVKKDAHRRGGAAADDWLQQQLRQAEIDEEDERARRKAAQQEKAAKGLADAMSPETQEETSEKPRIATVPLAEIRNPREGKPRPVGWMPLPVKPLAEDAGGDAPPIPTQDTSSQRAPKKEAKEGSKEAKKPVPEFYQLLGVAVDATFEEIRKGYRREALKWHPDKNRDKPEEATARFKKVSEAFDTLFDPTRREAYDSGQVLVEKKAKKLTGHGWSRLEDEDDQVLTPQGFKWKRQSWNTYVFLRGRIDDVDPIVDDPINDPRVPQEKIKVMWRFIGQKAWEAREERKSDKWLQDLIATVWKDTPSKWPGTVELKNMNEVAQQEWKERRMVYNRRKQKVLLNIELHEVYLAIPNRMKKEKERLQKARPELVGGELRRLQD